MTQNPQNGAIYDLNRLSHNNNRCDRAGGGSTFRETEAVPLAKPPVRHLPSSIKTYSDYVQNRKLVEKIHREKISKKKRREGKITYVHIHNLLTMLRTIREHELQEDLRDKELLLSPDNFGMLIDEYFDWMTHDQYIDLSKKGEGYAMSLRASKRGNSVYRARIQSKLDAVSSVFGYAKFFDPRDITRVHKTGVIKAVLTFKQDVSVFESWSVLKKRGFVNLFRSKLRQLLGCEISVARSYESHESGHPHINLVLVAPEGYFLTRFHREDGGGAWRILSYHNGEKAVPLSVIRKKWSYHKESLGFLDIKAVACVTGRDRDLVIDNSYPSNYQEGLSLEHHLKYFLKDLLKRPHGSKGQLQAAILWKMRMRSFSLGLKFCEAVRALLETHGLHNSNISPVNFEKFPGREESNYQFMGICVFGDIPPPLRGFNEGVAGFTFSVSGLRILNHLPRTWVCDDRSPGESFYLHAVHDGQLADEKLVDHFMSRELKQHE